MSGEGSWVEKRLAWLERAKGLRPEDVDVPIPLAAPVGAGKTNRHGMPSIPPGQHAVESWPILDLGHQPRMGAPEWRLEVCGEVERPSILTWEDLMAFPQVEVAADLHCVTSWTRLDLWWKGAKWIERMEFLSEDRLGYCEERGCSNSALPWLEDRSSSLGGEDE